MPFVQLSCPNCDHVLNAQISVDSASPRQPSEPRKFISLWDSAGRINLTVKFAAASQIEVTEPGQYKFATLYAAYNAMVDQGAVPAISPKDYAKLLTLLGCKPYRVADHRGYEVRPIRVDAVYSGTDVLRVDVELMEDGFPEGLDDETEPADEEEDSEEALGTWGGLPVVLTHEELPPGSGGVVIGFDGTSDVSFAVSAPPADVSRYMEAVAQDVKDLSSVSVAWGDPTPASREAFERAAQTLGIELPPTLRGMLSSQSGQVPDAPKEA